MMGGRAGKLRAASSCWLLLAGCTEDIWLLTDAGAAPAMSGARTAASTACDLAVQGTLARLRQDSGQTCGTLASETFRYSACTCRTMQLSAAFTVEGGAGLGSNRSFVASADLELPGSLRVAGSSGAVTLSGGTVHVRGNVSVNGALVLDRVVADLDRDLWLGGELLVANSQARIAGTIYQSAGHNVPADLTVANRVTREVTVPEPCPCTAALAQRGAMLVAPEGDDTLTTLSPSALSPAGPLTLSCGRYQVNTDGLVGEARWVVDGSAALVVTGDLEVTDRLDVDLGERGELDVFVLGSLRLAPGAQIATPRASGLRFYVQGSRPLLLAGGARFAGNLYAPDSNLVITEEQSFSGSLVVRVLAVEAATAIHYDPAVLADGCSEVTCTTDAECAAPLLCHSGRCRLSAE